MAAKKAPAKKAPAKKPAAKKAAPKKAAAKPAVKKVAAKPAAKKAAPKKAAKPAAKKAAAPKAAPKAVGPVKSRYSKSQIVQEIADITSVARKEVGKMLEHLEDIIARHLSPKGPGEFVLPGILKINAIK